MIPGTIEDILTVLGEEWSARRDSENQQWVFDGPDDARTRVTFEFLEDNTLTEASSIATVIRGRAT